MQRLMTAFAALALLAAAGFACSSDKADKPEPAAAKPKTTAAKLETTAAKPETTAAKPEAVADKPEAAAPQPEKAPESKETQEVRHLLADMEEAFSKGDAKAMAACWTPTGDFASSVGGRIEGRENIEKVFQLSLLRAKNATLKMHLLSLRVVNQGLAVADVVSEMKPAPVGQSGIAHATVVLVNSDKHWLIESAHETAVRATPVIDPLKDLEWLVGTWTTEGGATPDGIKVQSTCDWAANHSFLIRKFSASGGPLSHAGTEVIGWDPRTQRIRSWVFDSTGGFGENLWIRDGKRWLVKYSGTKADGSELSVTNIVTPVDADTIAVQSKDRIIDNRPQPDVPEITMKRQAVGKETPKPTEPAKPEGLPQLPGK
jgi:uncharacterized protein (TIGR02246 family)